MGSFKSKAAVVWVRWVPRVKPILLISLASLALSACVPKDTPTVVATAVATPSGFPGIRSAQTTGPTKVELTWPASTLPSTVAYNIYNTTSMFNPVRIKTVPATQTSESITGLTNENYYSFMVRAADVNDNEDTNTVQLGAIPYGGVISNNVISSSSAAITYSDATDADAVEVYCNTTLNPIYTQVAEIKNVTLLTYTLTALTPGDQYTCRVALNISGFVDNNLATTTFTPVGTATTLVFSSQPSSAQAGTVLATQPVVRIVDGNGNIVSAGPDSTAEVTLTISTAPNGTSTGGVILGTSETTAVGGVATFSGLSVTGSGSFILTATKAPTTPQPPGSGVLTQASSSFIISPGAVSPQTSSITVTAAGSLIAPLVADGTSTYNVTIVLKDQYGSPVSGITPVFATTDSADTLVEPATATDLTGTATGTITSTFANSLNSATITSPAGLSTLSALAAFIPGGPTKVAFTVEPTLSGAGALVPSVSVALEDRYGNVVNTGTGSTTNITVSLISPTPGPSQPPTLTGTTTLAAVNGVATFTNLSINVIANGYELEASGTGVSTTAFSTPFNVTAASPQKLAIFMVASAPTSTLSNNSPASASGCSAQIEVQLQDSGGNPSNTSVNQAITISGLGNAALYTSCGGTAQSTTRSVSIGSNHTTFYIKDPKAEALTLTATDPNGVLTTATLGYTMNPDKVALTTSSSTLIAGHCLPMTINTQGDNGINSANFNALNLTVGISSASGTPSATLWGDSTCSSTPLVATAIPYPAPQTTTPYGYTIYLKDNTAENLTLQVSDNAGILAFSGSLQTVNVVASNINFTGPSSVISGTCSGTTKQFTLKLQDAAGNAVTPSVAVPLTIMGLSQSTTGLFYVNDTCGSTGSSTSLIYPAGASSLNISFKDTTAESLSIYFKDPNGQMANSQTVTFNISPSALAITGTSTTSKTTACSSVLTAETLDSSGNNVNAILPLTVNLTGAGGGGGFYSDSLCTQPITTLSFSATTKQQPFYYMGQYPGSFVLSAADAAGVLSTGTYNYTVTAAPGFIGTSSNNILGEANNLVFFQKGVPMVSPRINGVSQVQSLHLGTAGNALYVSDTQQHKVHKFTYGLSTNSYVGWIGEYSFPNNNSNGATYSVSNDVVTGSSIGSLSASCASTNYQNPVPGWCMGGESVSNPYITNGAFNNPRGMTDDGTYLYVVNLGPGSVSAVSRFLISTGAFAGWIGQIASNSSITYGYEFIPAISAGVNNPSACGASGTTSGWCMNGQNLQSIVDTFSGSMGALVSANPITYDNQPLQSWGGYLYVGRNGAIMRYNAATGAYAGFIGFTGPSAGNLPTNCVSGTATVNAVTPSWCMNGFFTPVNAYANAGGVNNPTSLLVAGNYLYVLHQDTYGVITAYDLSQNGKLVGIVSTTNSTNFWVNPQAMTTDGNYIYVADGSRIIRLNTAFGITGWIGKISTTPSANGAGNTGTACSSLSTNQNTSGWCVNGLSKYGVDESSFSVLSTIDYDWVGGNLLTGGSSQNNGAGSEDFMTYSDTDQRIKQFSSASGAYQGSLGYQSAGITQWSNSTTDVAQFYGYDDYSMAQPEGSYSDGTYLYVPEMQASRVKKIQINTGQTIGWIGGLYGQQTGGIGANASICAPSGSFVMGPAPGWCLGGTPTPVYMWNQGIPYYTDGIMYMPVAVTGDGTNIYVVDYGLHRIQKFVASTGQYLGWIGGINLAKPPTGGASGCTTGGATITPGWCTGGYSTSGTGDGFLSNPLAITMTGGALFVVDYSNERVVQFNATSGAYVGWIGAFNVTPTGGCTTNYTNGTGYLVSKGGWCTGGTAQARGNTSGADGGGGFNFNWYRGGGITTDGTFLYISNTENSRIDKWTINAVSNVTVNGVTSNYPAATFVAGASSNPMIYTNVWTNTVATLQSFSTGNWFVRGIWTDPTGNSNIYGIIRANYITNTGFAFKMGLSTGTMIGWEGAILNGNSTYSPTAPAACASVTGVTPTWCQNGMPSFGLTLGGFVEATFISGDPGSSGFIYISDEKTGRVTRLPK